MPEIRGSNLMVALRRVALNLPKFLSPHHLELHALALIISPARPDMFEPTINMRCQQSYPRCAVASADLPGTLKGPWRRPAHLAV